MSIADFSDTVALWLEGGVPARLVWRDVRYTVTDHPTPLQVDADMFSAAVTHPPHSVLGWRFQGTSEAGGNPTFQPQGDGVAEVGDAHRGLLSQSNVCSS
jgi:hypothetical protein